MDRHGVSGDLEGDDGEDMLDWEMDLIRKGTGGQTAAEDPTGSLRKSMRQERGSSRHDDMDRPEDTATATLDEVQKELRDALISMQSLHESHTREVSGMDSELQSMRLDIEQAGQVKSIASQRYELFQRMRDYTLDVLDLLDEKMTTIEDSEDIVLGLRVKRGESLRAAEAQYVADAQDEIGALAGSNQTPQDEFGRDPGEARRSRLEARKAEPPRVRRGQRVGPQTRRLRGHQPRRKPRKPARRPSVDSRMWRTSTHNQEVRSISCSGRRPRLVLHGRLRQ